MAEIRHKEELTEEQKETVRKFYPAEAEEMIEEHEEEVQLKKTGKGKTRYNIGHPKYQPKSLERYEEDLKKLQATGKELRERGIDPRLGLLLQSQSTKELKRVKTLKQQAQARSQVYRQGVPITVLPGKEAEYKRGLAGKSPVEARQETMLVAGVGQGLVIKGKERQARVTKIMADEEGEAGEYIITQSIPYAEVRKDAVTTKASYIPMMKMETATYEEIKGVLGLGTVVQPTKIQYGVYYSGTKVGKATMEIPKVFYKEQMAKTRLDSIKTSPMPDTAKFGLGVVTYIDAHRKESTVNLGASVGLGAVWQTSKVIGKRLVTKVLPRLTPYGALITAGEIAIFGAIAGKSVYKDVAKSKHIAEAGYNLAPHIVSAVGFGGGMLTVARITTKIQTAPLMPKGKGRVTGRIYMGAVDRTLVKDRHLVRVDLPHYKGKLPGKRGSGIVVELPKETIKISTIKAKGYKQIIIEKAGGIESHATHLYKGTQYSIQTSISPKGKGITRLFKKDKLINIFRGTGDLTPTMAFTKPEVIATTKAVEMRDVGTGAIFKGAGRVKTAYSVDLGTGMYKPNIGLKVSEIETRIAKPLHGKIFKTHKLSKVELDTRTVAWQLKSFNEAQPGLKWGGEAILPKTDKIKVDLGEGIRQELISQRYLSLQKLKANIKFEGELLPRKTKIGQVYKSKNAQLFRQKEKLAEVRLEKLKANVGDIMLNIRAPVEMLKVRATPLVIPSIVPTIKAKTNVDMDINLSGQFKLKEKLDVIPELSLHSKQIDDLKFLTGVGQKSTSAQTLSLPSVRISPSLEGGYSPSFDIGFIPIPTGGLPGFGGKGLDFGFGKTKRKRKGKKATYKPSLIGMATGVKELDKMRIVTGFGVRGL